MESSSTPKDKVKANRAELWVNLVKSFQLVFKAHPPATIAIAIVALITAFLPVAQAWVGKLIVDGVVDAIKQQPKMTAMEGFYSVMPWLLIELGLFTMSSVLGQVRSLIERMLSARIRHEIQTRIMRKAMTLDLQFFEDSEFYDMLRNATIQADWRALDIMRTGFGVVQGGITLASFVVMLFAFNPIITLILFGAAIPAFLAQKRFSELDYSLHTGRATKLRLMGYYESLLTDNTSVKEVKLFGLGEPILKRYLDLFWQFYHEDTSLNKRRSIYSLLFGLLASVAYYGAYGWIVYSAIGGMITLGGMTLYLSLFTQSQGAFSALLSSFNELYENTLFMSNLFNYLNIQPRVPASTDPKPMPKAITQGIEFRNVSFKYPQRDQPAIKNVSLTIRPGEKIALVGANGAGKTTFIKLLTRLYDPTEGQILLDGVDLREYDFNELREKIGVVLQDFVEYNASARENIGFGKIDALEDQLRIEMAAAKGGADEVVAVLPKGYDTMLGYMADEGTNLSGGQWQKIALARAFMRDADILVLDEPTSALDAEREYELFKRFRDLTEGRISLLISHRFSTVRIADRIAVLNNGELLELGTHQELLKAEGTYAKLFNMQAEGYR